MKLTQLFDYFGQLSAQFPIAPIRIVYAKAGTLPAACILRNEKFVVENLLYWTPTATDAEARYLCAVINSETARSRVEAQQARGQFGARHFDKVIFNLPIPRFDSTNALHRELASYAARAEKIAAEIELPEGIKFQRARKVVRSALVDAKISPRIDKLVANLLDGA